MRPIGINTWVWRSPLTDDVLDETLDAVAAFGFDAVELPLEQVGDLSATRVVAALERTGLVPCVVGAMAPGRDLIDPGAIEGTQQYLRACIDLAADIGARSVCGPFYAATGRVWSMTPDQREQAYATWRTHLAPVVEHAEHRGVRVGIEPLNRYETSLVNTVEQALTGLDGLLGPALGLALDTYHLNIEERSSAAAITAAAEHLVHVQVCGNDRGAPGHDQTDWPGILDALDATGYDGPLVIESFTSENTTIATAASIWRSLAPTQDDLARDGLAFLRELTAHRNGGIS
ncbi:sugar phosphate isomerase/epimerase [Aeromicrobium phragmitis]|uniref:Sugar phosphate isomerase/epimerase n=1 Tax=Aeromicrobium phragmitis TaxID=2478914 RepID=A0A3L8PLF5_9ACTN|nr:sugar phosphate isomerase/epimerase family protein [Aeromicrobium phragmitis]RLV56207.1 sugar phosphate isomerase/epimerase [Aeromicrobium phragmitis]